MVKVLERVPSLGEQLGSSIGKGLGGGFSQGMDVVSRLMRQQQKDTVAQEKKRQKDIERATTFLRGEIKSRAPTYGSPSDFEKVRSQYISLLEEGLDPNEALEQTLQSLKESPSKESNLFSAPEERRKDVEEGLRHISGAYTSKGREQAEYPFGAASALTKHPKEFLSELPTQAVELAEQLAALNPVNLPATLLGKGLKTPVADYIRKLTGHSELSPEAQEEIGLGNLLLSAFLPTKGIKGLKGLGGGAKAAAAAEAPVAEASSLAGRAGKALEGATEARIARTAPEQRLFKSSEEAALREKQLKSHPQYLEEIERDAAERSARQNKFPKTQRGEASMESRKLAASSELPKAQSLYHNAAARVRALEEKIVSLSGEEKKRAEALLDFAKKELQQSEFNLGQVSKASLTGETGASLEQMEQSAQRKLIDLGDKAAKGEEIVLSKADYAPDQIHLAKQLAKKKPLPVRPVEDLFSKIQDIYANQYKNRLAQLNEELLATPKSVFGSQQKLALEKEKEAIEKLIQSSEARKAVHQHKLGLRELAERNRANQRFKSLEKTKANPKVTETATQAMWKGRIEDALHHPESIPGTAKEIIEEASAQNPKLASALKKEEKSLGDLLREMRGESKAASKNPLKDFQAKMQDLLGKIPVLGKTQLGKDVAVGIITAVWDELAKQIGIPVSSGAVISASIGRLRGAPIRVIVNQLSRHLIKMGKVGIAKQARKTHNEKLFSRFSPKIQKEALSSD